MKWVEGITEAGVWSSKGKIDLGQQVELDDDDADFLIGREQVMEIPAPSGEPVKRKPGRPKGSKNKPKAEGADAEAEDKES